MTTEGTPAVLGFSEGLGPGAEACPTCGSDCNERDELIKAEREIERLNTQRRELQTERERLLDSLARAGLDGMRMVLQERERCAALCLRPPDWLTPEQQAIATEIRNAILGNAGRLQGPNGSIDLEPTK
jgi:hypothetical protein